MSQNDHDDTPRPGDDEPGDDGFGVGGGQDAEELQRMLREFLSGNGAGAGVSFDPAAFAKAAGLPGDQDALQGLFATLQQAMQHPGEGIDWGIARRTAIDVAGEGGPSADPTSVMRAFPVATLWLDEVTEVGQAPDAPRAITRIEWAQQTMDTWISLAEPVAESISRALMDALEGQIPEELSGALGNFGPVL
ncbi:MAG: zinc-dependent metalloprotease, partial [Actinobacteria bacterium]|nr:zinc-dependent metalloprotease [Actinomycetota bacterium]